MSQGDDESTTLGPAGEPSLELGFKSLGEAFWMIIPDAPGREIAGVYTRAGIFRLTCTSPRAQVGGRGGGKGHQRSLAVCRRGAGTRTPWTV